MGMQDLQAQLRMLKEELEALEKIGGDEEENHNFDFLFDNMGRKDGTFEELEDKIYTISK